MSTIRANTIVGVDGVSAVILARQVAAKGWVNFNGTNASIRSSFNTSSVTRNTTGDWTKAFSIAYIDNQYAFVSTTGNSGTGVGWNYGLIGMHNNGPLTTSVNFRTAYGTSQVDEAVVSCVITR